MVHAHTIGRLGEDFVQSYLAQRGYQTVHRNYRVRGGEIDLIVCRGQQVVFVEVKTRHAANRSSGPEDVSPFQVRRLLRLAEYYVVKQAIEDWRFVLACVVLGQGQPKLRLVELTECQ